MRERGKNDDTHTHMCTFNHFVSRVMCCATLQLEAELTRLRESLQTQAETHRNPLEKISALERENALLKSRLETQTHERRTEAVVASHRIAG